MKLEQKYYRNCFGKYRKIIVPKHDEHVCDYVDWNEGAGKYYIEARYSHHDCHHFTNNNFYMSYGD